MPHPEANGDECIQKCNLRYVSTAASSNPMKSGHSPPDNKRLLLHPHPYEVCPPDNKPWLASYALSQPQHKPPANNDLLPSAQTFHTNDEGCTF
jgi:hypothetical protein